MNITITILYAGLLGLIYLGLTVRVIRFRGRHQVGIGDGGHSDLARAIRVHANFGEYVPLLLVLMGFIEASGGAAWALHAIGIVLVVGRVAHAFGLAGTEGASLGRAVGAGGTTLLLLGCSVWAVLLGLGIG